MKKADKKQRPAIKESDEEKYYEHSVTSTTDCTGLMPTRPITDDEEESYTDIYDIPRPKHKENKQNLRHPG
ncbi:MAG TPA: hypothetical protein PLZ84_08755 [Clostridia bacterium]|nr:hypothetical protein [Clostridia bacterium]